MTFSTTPRRSAWALALGVAAALAVAAPARAANLDKQLLMQQARDGGRPSEKYSTEMERLLSHLGKQNYKNVGVLPFRVLKGKAKTATFVAAPLATTFPTRLEAAMLLSMDPRGNVVGVIQDATATASAQKVGAWAHDKSAFARLFAASYQLPYGGTKVKADAFLTGVITCTDGMKTKVDIQVFDRNSLKGSSLKLTRVASFEVENDRALLRDLGFGYALPRTAVARGTTAKTRDAAARGVVARRLTARKRSDDPDAEPGNIGGLAFELLYDGQKQALKSLTTEGNTRQYEAPPVKAGAKVTMSLKRLAAGDKILGAVLRVNGESTYKREKDLAAPEYTRWLWSPDNTSTQTFAGFYLGDKLERLLPWATLEPSKSATMVSELGERAGWIDLDVYESGEPGGGDGDEMQVTLRGLARARSAKPKSLKELQANLRKVNNLKPRLVARPRSLEGGLIMAGVEEQPSPPVDSKSFPGPRRVGGISIRYYDKAKGGGDGVTITED